MYTKDVYKRGDMQIRRMGRETIGNAQLVVSNTD